MRTACSRSARRAPGRRPAPPATDSGGERATLTDAFAVCGWIGHAALGYDAVRVDCEAARRAVDRLAAQLGEDLPRTASAIIDVAVSGMYAGISGVVSRHGVDPRGFPLLAFGGAGPMLACFIAREIGMTHIVVPTAPGVLSALGGLIAELKNDFVETVYRDLIPRAMPDLAASVARLRARGEHWLRHEQHYDGPATIRVSAEMRYRGQSFELDTALAEDAFAAGRIGEIADAFHARHRHVYGYATPETPVQIVALRVIAAGASPRPELARIARAETPLASIGEAAVWIGGAQHAVPLYERAALLSGHRFAGPAIVTQADCTTCILPGFTACIDDHGSIHIEAAP